MKIILTKRSHDWHACLDGNTVIWGCGESPKEAIGDLIYSHQAMFPILVVNQEQTSEPFAHNRVELPGGKVVMMTDQEFSADCNR
ncbi:hypothetical protein H0W91_00410 [Patescibacteria group bacterium]|nr:hypothetical protein [Patescibacteria group bacterium]